MKICVSIASYRDPDLINTVTSAYENAINKKDISFCIVSQDEDGMHPDLMHIPNVYYYKYHWSQSQGLCWARNIAINKSVGDYILQVDSHSRFENGWDEIIERVYSNASKYWGDRIIITKNCNAFEIKDNGEIEYQTFDIQMKTKPTWYPQDNRFALGKTWEEVEDRVHGDEVFYMSGGCTFAAAEIYKSVAPDPAIYAEDQLSTAIRAYTRGIRIIFSPENYVYSLHDKSQPETRDHRFTGEPPKLNRILHYNDHPEWKFIHTMKSWSSDRRLDKLYRGEIAGFWGIESKSLYNQFIKINDVYFINNIEDSDRLNECQDEHCTMH